MIFKNYFISGTRNNVQIKEQYFVMKVKNLLTCNLFFNKDFKCN
jgi:hypothetical protein